MKIKDRYDARKVLIHREKIEILMSGGIPSPVCVEIDPADGYCNHSRLDCCYGSSQRGTLRLIDRDQLLKTLPELASSGVKSVEWVGGSEPLLHPDISLFIRVANDYGMRCGVVTNGEMLPRITENILSDNLSYVRVSLDAAAPEVFEKVHNSQHFNRVIVQLRGILQMDADPSIFGISFRIMEANIGDIALAAKIMSQLGVAYIQYKYSLNSDCTEINRGNDELIIEQINLAKQFRSSSFEVLGGETLNDNAPEDWTRLQSCISSPLVGVITAGGDIPFCIRYRNNPDMYIGNIRDGFLNVWGGLRHKEMLTQEACQSCRYICKHHKYNRVIRKYCQGGYFPEVIAEPYAIINPEFI